MPSKEDRKKQKQRLKDHKRALEQRRRFTARQSANRFPKITVEPAGGDPEFVAEIEKLVSTYSFDDPDCCSDEYRSHFQLISTVGFIEYARRLYSASTPEMLDRPAFEATVEKYLVDIRLHVGNWLFNHLPARFTAPPLPQYFFRTDMGGRDIEIRFDLLESVGEPHNPLFILPEKPTVEMQGARWQVGLYGHALESMCRRLNLGDNPGFNSNMSMYFMLTESMFAYEPVNLVDGAEALRVDFAMPLESSCHTYYSDYARRILGLPENHRFTSKDEIFTVLGYLPLTIQGKYARAKTFLLPGFSKTPEHALARGKKLTHSEQVMLRAMTDESQRTDDIEGKTVEAIKWYHDNGVPQVFPRSASRIS